MISPTDLQRTASHDTFCLKASSSSELAVFMVCCTWRIAEVLMGESYRFSQWFSQNQSNLRKKCGWITVADSNMWLVIVGENELISNNHCWKQLWLMISIPLKNMKLKSVVHMIQKILRIWKTKNKHVPNQQPPALRKPSSSSSSS